MEPISNIPNSVKGTEVLHFPDAEISKSKGSDNSFASFGGLSVLYFKDYNRFLLQLNDWRYPLLRRLSVQSSGNGSYTLPALNGFSYNLRINSADQSALKSLDSLLEGTRKLEASPEDKLLRKPMHKASETGPKEVITETVKQTVKKIQNKAATLTTGTKYLTSTKRRINMKDLKNKDFKKEAQSRFKKDFFQSSEKLSSEFLQKRRDLSTAGFRDFEGLRKLDGPVMHIPREEVEEAILAGKDAFDKPSQMEMNKPQGRADSRVAGSEVQGGNMPVAAEGMTHYQG